MNYFSYELRSSDEIANYQVDMLSIDASLNGSLKTKFSSLAKSVSLELLL